MTVPNKLVTLCLCEVIQNVRGAVMTVTNTTAGQACDPDT